MNNITTISFPDLSVKGPKKVILCIPTVSKPYQVTLDAIEASVPSLDAAGWEHGIVFCVGCPYISHARSKMLRQALDAGADAIIFIDHDLSWQPDALVRLLETEGDVVSGTYRFKREPEEYMGSLMTHDDGKPIVRADGCLEAYSIPAGFLKITRAGVCKFMSAYKELCYGDECTPLVDLFNHGAWGGVWWGEDYAFARRWREKCGKVWIVPDLQIDHHTTTTPYPGNFHLHLRAQPGGDLHKAT